MLNNANEAVQTPANDNYDTLKASSHCTDRQKRLLDQCVTTVCVSVC